MSLTHVLLQAGLLSDGVVAELRHWKMPGVATEGGADKAITDIAVLQRNLDAALQDKDLVHVRVTDPTLIHQYLNTQTRGTLHVHEGPELGSFQIVFGRTGSGEYIFPWSSELLEDAFQRGDVRLLADGACDEHSFIYFFSTDVYYYGEQKAFIVCSTTKNN